MTQKTVALITGANKGLGLEIARQLGKQGMAVVLGARDKANGAAAAAELRKHDIDRGAGAQDTQNRPQGQCRAPGLGQDRHGR